LKATIVPSVVGVFSFGEDGKLVEKILFPKDTLKVAERLIEVESGRAINEIVVLVKNLEERGYSSFVFENPEMAQAVRKELKVVTEVEAPSRFAEALRENLARYAVEAGFLESALELSKWVHDVSMEISKIKVRRAAEKRDVLIVQAVQALDELDKTLNLLMSRIREWYGLHFPELDRLLEKHEIYARLVRDLGRKDGFTEENIEKQNVPKNKAVQLAKAARTSMGADFYDVDMEQIQILCGQSLELYGARSKLEMYLDEVMKEAAPNTRALAGATLGARLIAIAGGIGNLAKRPASTIQVLGAEKALFRSLTTGARPPKHGIIFQHPLVHGSKRWLRGKVARALAGKLSIAVRTDAFSGNLVGDRLKEDLRKRIEEMWKKHAEPKPRAQLKSSHRRRKKYGRKG